MDLSMQALVLGIVQGLTEFLPISSSGHLIVVPYLLGWNDPFIDSLAFSVMLHMGTLVALLAYFWRDWVRLVPAGLAAIRDRSLADDPDRRLAWLLVVTAIPGAIVGVLLNDFIEQHVRLAGSVAVLLVIGAVILYVADRTRPRLRAMTDLSFAAALGIGLAQAVALFPGISRSGISISAARFLGLDRENAARFSFLMATPIIAGAGLFEARKMIGADSGLAGHTGLIAIGFAAALVSGLVAIAAMLRFLRTNSLTVFVVYRIVLAAVVLVVFLSR
jgi:undecaprenyl-diphosphatase